MLFVLRCSYVNDQFLHGGRDPHDRPVQTITLGIPSLLAPAKTVLSGLLRFITSNMRTMQLYSVDIKSKLTGVNTAFQYLLK